MTDDRSPEAADYPQAFKDLCVAAFRFALDYDGAPARCKKRHCARSGRCHFTMSDDRPGVCDGGLPGEVAEHAGLMLAFFADAMGWTQPEAEETQH